MTEPRRLALLAAIRARRRLLRDLAARKVARLEAQQADLRDSAERCQALLLTAPPATGTPASLRAGATLRDLLARAAEDGATRAATLAGPIRAAREELAAASAALRAVEDAQGAACREAATLAEAAALLDLPTAHKRRATP
jgi:hypothetical protein